MTTTQAITPEMVTQVQESWNRLGDSADAATQLFFDRIEELDPELPLGRSASEARNLAARLFASAVTVLDQPALAAERLAQLGRAAIRAGLTSHHAPLITVAVLWTLEQSVGEPLRPETRRAWAAFCSAFMHALPTEPSSDGAPVFDLHV